MSEQMQTEEIKTEEIKTEEITVEDTAPEETTVKEVIPSMAEFEEQINRSFKKISEGDILKGTVVAVSDTEVSVDLRYYAEGIIRICFSKYNTTEQVESLAKELGETINTLRKIMGVR